MKKVYVYNLLDNRKLIKYDHVDCVCAELGIKREDVIECMAFGLRYGIALYFSNKPLPKYDLIKKLARPMLGFED